MNLKNRKLGILLFNGPENQDIRTVIGLATTALKSGVEVELFLMYEGVLNAAYKPLQELSKEKNINITVCTHNADELKAFKFEGFKYGSQYDNSFIANESDQYISFI